MRFQRISFFPNIFFSISYFTEKMDEENQIICKVLVLFPSNYEQLCSWNNGSLNLAKLPQDPAKFYSISNYKFNIKNFEAGNKISKNEDNKDSTNQSYNLLKEEINSLKSDINQLKLNDAIKDKKIEEQGKIIVKQDKELKDHVGEYL